jgi:hypothetical protein
MELIAKIVGTLGAPILYVIIFATVALYLFICHKYYGYNNKLNCTIAVVIGLITALVVTIFQMSLGMWGS